jgi:hypothetical protein
LFEENFETSSFTSSGGHPERPLWFDIRIWRIAEIILHSASVYRGLGIPPDEPYALVVTHGGLDDREFYTSNMRRLVRRSRLSSTQEVSWTKEVTQDYVKSNLHSLVRELANELFVVFDFMQVEDSVIDDITNEFLGTRR